MSFIFGKKNNLMYLLAFLTTENLKKKFLERIQSYDHASFLDSKWPISPTFFFSEKPLK